MADQHMLSHLHLQLRSTPEEARALQEYIDGDYFYCDDVSLTELRAVPEPATFGFMAIGLGLIYGVSRRVWKSRS